MSYRDLFEDWEVGLTMRLIRQFQRKWTCLKREELEDLLQECLSHWHFVKNNNCPKGEASQKTFMAHVMRNKLTDLVRERESDKRRIAHLGVSLDLLMEIEEDSRIIIDLAGDVDNFDVSYDPRHRIDLEIDLSKVWQKLTSFQKRLCLAIGEEGLTMNKASQQLKIPRAVLRREIERIRAVFRRESLHKYLS